MWNRILERPGSVCALILTLLSSPVLSLPALAEIDRARFAEVLGAARAYAGERTLLFYCLRNDPEVRTMLFLASAPRCRARPRTATRRRQRPSTERAAGRNCAVQCPLYPAR